MYLMDLSEEEIVGLEEDVFYNMLVESYLPYYGVQKRSYLLHLEVNVL